MLKIQGQLAKMFDDNMHYHLVPNKLIVRK